MAETRRVWQEALDMAVRLGMIPPERAVELAGTITGATEIDPAALATSAGLPLAAMDALFRLANAMPTHAPTGPSDPTVSDRGMATLAEDLSIEIEAPPHPTDAPQPVELTLKTKEAAPQRWHFKGPATVLLGRSQRAHVRIDDTYASGLHAVIEITGLGCRLRDYHSINHSYVNSAVLKGPRELAQGDEIRIGRTRFEVSIHFVPHPATVELRAHSDDPEVPGYAMETLLGRGTQGTVYLAKDLRHGGRLIALKTLSLTYAMDEDECERRAKHFLREAMIAPAFRHPHVVEIHAAGRSSRTLYIAMEYLPGGDLGAYLRRNGPLPHAIAGRFLLQALEAMAVAHERNLIHRDIKPENLLLTRPAPDADLKVADLGLAKNFVLAGLSGFTESGMCAGTPIYMAPEQFLDFKYATPAADVFSLGAVFFRLLTGKGQYDSVIRHTEDIEGILEAAIPSVASIKADLPPRVVEVVDRALQRESSERYEMAGQMRDALRAALEC